MADIQKLKDTLNDCAAREDFEGAMKLVRENQADLVKAMTAAGVKDALKKTTKDRLLLSFLDGAEFGARPFAESLVRLEKLVSFQPGERVLSKSIEWGLGTIKRLDHFYKRITVDFRAKKGHQFSYAAAADMLVVAPENHVLVLQSADPAAFETLLKDKPGDFVKLVISSFGGMPIQRLEDVCVKCGFVKAQNWKQFWEKARTALRQDKCVVIPVKRTDPIEIKASAEDYGDAWLTAFSHETDPKLILAGVREFEAQGKFKNATEEVRNAIGDRLDFAVTAARLVDDALYARLATTVVALGYLRPAAESMRGYLWERKRFVKAAAALPAREVGAMISFLSENDEARLRLCAAVPDLCYTAVCEIVSQFSGIAECRAALAKFMTEPKAPATLTTLFVGSYQKFKDAWPELPPFITLLTHAIALGEGRQGGETLKMQNIVRRLFADKTWLEKVFAWLQPSDRALFFERFQASIAWEASTHHAIVVRMTRIAPELEGHVVKAEKKREYARLTSPRSFWMRKCDYLRLINEEMPANIKRIEYAKGFGDLSENAEYQYAKDEQRALMQKQSLMQADLEAVKPSEFADATTDEVMPGVTVAIETPDGAKTYHILGEWDNVLEKGIISSKARLAVNMLGKKVGDQFELPGAEGQVAFGKVAAISPLPQDIRDWMKLPEGAQI